MNTRQPITILFIIIAGLLISGCGPTQFVSISAGDAHTCALTSGGGVKCWGNNEYGQLGDDTTIQRAAPVDVSGLTGGVIAIAAGGDHTCALVKSQPEASSGGVRCWGNNKQGQLGDGTTTQHTTPVSVSGLNSGVIAIAAGYGHNCALIVSGEVKCWGLNGQGQLGDGSVTTKSPFGKTIPVTVSGLAEGVSAITAGHAHNCALIVSGGVKCWGYNPSGDPQPTPVDVSGLTSGVTAFTAGHGQTCALVSSPQGASSGGVKCWGTNAYGELGDGATAGRTTPVDVMGLTGGVSAIAAGYEHTCALMSPMSAATPSQGALGGAVKCWGSNGWGELGNATSVYYSPTPLDVNGLTNGAIAITAGHGHTCALIASPPGTSGGQIKCWGSNAYGQLGNGVTIDSSLPVNVKN